jgi:hypothetical protein
MRREVIVSIHIWEEEWWATGTVLARLRTNMGLPLHHTHALNPPPQVEEGKAHMRMPSHPVLPHCGDACYS